MRGNGKLPAILLERHAVSPSGQLLLGGTSAFIGQSCFQLGKNSLKITTAVEDAKDRYGIGGDQERNHRAAFETENP